MSTHLSDDRFAGASPRFRARLAGIFYLVNIITSLIAFSGKGSHWLMVVSGLAATASYITVTALLYYLFKPVNPTVSLTAALFSLLGCAVGVLAPLHLFPFHIHSLVFFGFYCLLIGYLILRSTFMPRILGVLMAMAGLGWLSFVYQPLAKYLTPYHYIMGGIGEGLLTLWLLVMGVNAGRWEKQATNSREAVSS
ncbi:MAG TPA: DUF4386 domain-containing protein [Terracidiphilus sp.]|nr:DUF4386 domain-containing protein [Terracidiphilus sp.]